MRNIARNRNPTNLLFQNSSHNQFVPKRLITITITIANTSEANSLPISLRARLPQYPDLPEPKRKGLPSQPIRLRGFSSCCGEEFLKSSRRLAGVQTGDLDVDSRSSHHCATGRHCATIWFMICIVQRRANCNSNMNSYSRNFLIGWLSF